MAQYSIGQVEKISGIKAHVLRYWEEVVPSIAPLKNIAGHRVYTQRHLEIILRMKYLIYTKGFTIEGARNQILNESQYYAENSETLRQISILKQELGDLYLSLQKRISNE
ncbi:MAG: MerR family transcriptional regulator [Treponema sp.]|nr:MerR family transcriptional regulator [Spirochaetia bacterium]MDD7014454.1 MerR family transcriptional regulator [Spirochaetales bacterium]MDY4903118.1 MerR family transcriptional regulator [Treponema sp.]